MRHDIWTRGAPSSFVQAGKPFDKAAYMAALRLNLRRNIVHEIDRRVAESIYDHIKDTRWRKDRQELFTRYLANLRIADEQCVPVRLSRDSHYYSGKKFGYRQLIGMLERMLEVGLIEQAVGHFNRENGWECGDQTRIWPTYRLIELYAVINPDEIVLEPPDLVQVRKRQTYLQKLRGQEAVELPVPRNRRVRRMLSQLKRYGELLQQTTIVFHKRPGSMQLKELNKLVDMFTLYNYDKLRVLEFPFCPTYYSRTSDYRDRGTGLGRPGPRVQERLGCRETHTHNIAAVLKYKQLHRVFTDNLKLGGRYYGAVWQMFSKELRKHLFIDGSPVVEWDYSGLHLRMLYHREGMDYCGDPYDFGRPEWRSCYKLAALVLINKKTGHGLVNAIRKTFTENGLHEEFGIDILLDPVIEQMISDFEKAHNRINMYFCSDIGLRLQYFDSQITSDILDYFLEREIPVLPIHDSYIVAEQYEDELYEVMREKYRDRMGFYPIIHS